MPFGPSVRGIGGSIVLNGRKYRLDQRFRTPVFARIVKALRDAQDRYEWRFLREGLEPDPRFRANEKHRRSLRAKLLRLGVGATYFHRRLFTDQHLSEACKLCPEGNRSARMNPVVTTKCPATCFPCYTPSKDQCGPPDGWYESVRDRMLRHERLDFLSFTGGEPLLEIDKVTELIRLARNRFGRFCHIYLYTSGLIATRKVFQRLKDAGLDEIRFNISAHGYSLNSVRLAKEFFRAVVIETPVIPEDKERIMGLLPELDGIGVLQITLHELLYFGHSGAEYRRRGYFLKDPRFKPFYFQEAVPILGSEEAIYEILEFARRNRIRTPVHYCSCELKQLFQHRNNAYYNALRNLPQTRQLDRTGISYATLIPRRDRRKALADLPAGTVSYDNEIGFVEVHPDRLPCLDPRAYEVAVGCFHFGLLVGIGRIAPSAPGVRRESAAQLR